MQPISSPWKEMLGVRYGVCTNAPYYKLSECICTTLLTYLHYANTTVEHSLNLIGGPIQTSAVYPSYLKVDTP